MLCAAQLIRNPTSKEMMRNTIGSSGMPAARIIVLYYVAARPVFGVAMKSARCDKPEGDGVTRQYRREDLHHALFAWANTLASGVNDLIISPARPGAIFWRRVILFFC